MTWQDNVGAIFGFILIAMGLAYFLIPRFSEFAFTYTLQGNIWKAVLGEKWAPVVAKYVFSLISIAFGVWVIYAAIMGV
jgi:hypothetical protein